MSAIDLISEFGFDATVVRYGAGSYGSDGIYVDGTETNLTVFMSIQPVTGQELLNLPEAQRTKKIMKAYCGFQLYTASQSPSNKADLVAYDGSLYEVQQVMKWTSNDNVLAPHWKVILAEVNPVQSSGGMLVLGP